MTPLFSLLNAIVFFTSNITIYVNVLSLSRFPGGPASSSLVITLSHTSPTKQCVYIHIDTHISYPYILHHLFLVNQFISYHICFYFHSFQVLGNPISLSLSLIKTLASSTQSIQTPIYSIRMSSRRSRQPSSSRITDDQIIQLVSKLQQHLPEIRSSRSDKVGFHLVPSTPSPIPETMYVYK